MNLVIVESPAKAKTIEGYLGKEYTVKSSYGHVRDLAKKGLAIDVDKRFEPTYEVMADKKKVIDELKKLVKTAEMVWLATDEDREGEAISWHLSEVLKLNANNTKRIIFNEITKPAILKAIENPRSIDQNLVNAQQARRVLDRLVGFELSPVLWKKVKPSLSAGRVQSVTVRLIVEREQEINNFISQSAFRVQADFNVEGKTLKATLNHRFQTLQEAQSFLESCKNSTFTVASLDKKPAKRTPAGPFTTSTLQQEASRKLGFSVNQTMVVAQKLYESGKITYMRTDSMNLSDTATSAAKELIPSQFGERYLKVRKFSTKSKGAQEAHEAIRPTNFSVSEIGGDSSERRLYELIWKRTVASQMADAELERTTLVIDVSGSSYTFQAKGEVITFDGFLKLYVESNDDENEDDESGLIPPINKGEKLIADKIIADERFTSPPARYTEASLVRKLEELGIGRPSTYAPTISTVQKRGYVVKEDREGDSREISILTLQNNILKTEKRIENFGREKSKLFPTDIGIVVNGFLTEHFNQIMDYHFTADVEKQFDDIAEGKLEWQQMLEKFYKKFHSTVEHTLENSEKATGERLLGVDPTTGKNVYARLGRFGPMIQIGESEDEEKPQFSSLQKEQSIQDINLEQALDLFKLPRKLGTYEEKEVSVSVGRFGPYVKHGSKFVSIRKQDGDDPLKITLERAVELIVNKQQQEANQIIKQFEEQKDLQILNGRYGPYIKFGTRNIKIPKGKTPENLTLDECLELANSTPEKKKSSRKKG